MSQAVSTPDVGLFRSVVVSDFALKRSERRMCVLDRVCSFRIEPNGDLLLLCIEVKDCAVFSDVVWLNAVSVECSLDCGDQLLLCSTSSTSSCFSVVTIVLQIRTAAFFTASSIDQALECTEARLQLFYVLINSSKVY